MNNSKKPKGRKSDKKSREKGMWMSYDDSFFFSIISSFIFLFTTPGFQDDERCAKRRFFLLVF